MKHVINRYGNGNYYSKVTKCSYSLRELTQMKADGEPIEVRCLISGEDITKDVFKAKFFKCEFCPTLIRAHSEDTVCGPCDKELIAEEKAFQASQMTHRKCRECNAPLRAGRYFNCEDCVPPSQMESEDQMFERANPIGWGNDSEPAPSHKHCVECNISKPLPHFQYKDKEGKNRARRRCDDCRAQRLHPRGRAVLNLGREVNQ